MSDPKFISKGAYGYIVGELLDLKNRVPTRYAVGEDGSLVPIEAPKISEVRACVDYLLGGMRRLPKEIDKLAPRETVSVVCKPTENAKAEESEKGKTLGQIGGAFLGR